MIQGQTKNIALPPIGTKDLDHKEIFIPFHVDLRNGKITTIGNWEKRNGYAENWDTGFDDSIDLLISVDNGYAITEDGRVYDLTTTPTRITGQDLTGTGRPQFAKFEDDVIIVDGSSIVLDTLTKTTSDTGFSILPKYIGRVGAYTLYAGYDDTEFTWSAANNPTNIITGDSGSTNVKKTGKIKYATDFKNKWLVFKDNEIEIWHNRGGTTPFVRLNELTINFGLGASYSVVIAEDTLFWLDPDKNFRSGQGQIISDNMDAYLKDKIQNIEDIYGFHYKKERIIRWFSPVDGLCIVYDYAKQLWSEDNHYEHGQFERLPHNSYMELNGKQYFGDFEPTGKVFEWSEDNKDDDGTRIRVLRQFKVKLNELGNFGTVNRVRLMMKSRTNTLTVTDPQVLLRWRFDEEAEDTEWFTETIDINTDTSQPYYNVFGLGLGRTIEFQIVETNSVDFLLTGMTMTVKDNTI